MGLLTRHIHALPSLTNITNLIGRFMVTYNSHNSHNIATQLFKGKGKVVSVQRDASGVSCDSELRGRKEEGQLCS
jgi:hypothetical protein